MRSHLPVAGTLLASGLLAVFGLQSVAGAAPHRQMPQAATAHHGVPLGDITHSCSASLGIDSFDDSLDKTTFQGSPVADLSALAPARGGNLFALSDRSLLFTLDGHTKKPVRKVALADQNGKPLDSEALVADRDGSLLITSETEPSVRRYTPGGKLLGQLPVPAELQVAPAGRATLNTTFEGLALQPGGKTLVASMEGSLSGDASDIVRFQTWKRDGHSDRFKVAAQFGFTTQPGLGVSDIAATGDGRLLVLERSLNPLVPDVALYLANPRGATDVRHVKDLTDSGKGVRLMQGTELGDINSCPSLGATSKVPLANPLLDNIEGMVVTGHERGGVLDLLMVSDDNENSFQTTRLYSMKAKLPRE